MIRPLTIRCVKSHAPSSTRSLPGLPPPCCTPSSPCLHHSEISENSESSRDAVGKAGVRPLPRVDWEKSYVRRNPNPKTHGDRKLPVSMCIMNGAWWRTLDDHGLLLGVHGLQALLRIAPRHQLQQYNMNRRRQDTQYWPSRRELSPLMSSCCVAMRPTNWSGRVSSPRCRSGSRGP